eukprot:scaffold85392_cov30-Tisochrysis_lutea.AAC.10
MLQHKHNHNTIHPPSTATFTTPHQLHAPIGKASGPDPYTAAVLPSSLRTRGRGRPDNINNSTTQTAPLGPWGHVCDDARHRRSHRAPVFTG